MDIPKGFKQVSKEVFYEKLFADRRDIMPTLNNPNFTDWQVVETREKWGWEFPGWRNGGDPNVAQVYALKI